MLYQLSYTRAAVKNSANSRPLGVAGGRAMRPAERALPASIRDTFGAEVLAVRAGRPRSREEET